MNNDPNSKKNNEGNWGITTNTESGDKNKAYDDHLENQSAKSRDQSQEPDPGEVLGDAVASAAMDYLNKKLELIKKAWEETVDIPLMGLVEDAALAAINYKEIGKTFADSVLKYTQKLVGIESDGGWLDLLDELGAEGMDEIMSNPATLDALSNLDIIKNMATFLDGVTQCIDAVAKVWEVVEPVLPYIKIISEACAAFGTGIAESCEDATKEAFNGWQTILSLSMGILRECLKDVKVSMPSIIADMSVFFESAINAGWGNNQWLEAAFSDSAYRAMIRDAEDAVSDWSWANELNSLSEVGAADYLAGHLGEYASEWEWMKWMNSSAWGQATLSFVKNLVSTAMANVYNPSSWVYTSAIWSESTENIVVSSNDGSNSTGADNGFTHDDVEASKKIAMTLEDIQFASGVQYANI